MDLGSTQDVAKFQGKYCGAELIILPFFAFFVVGWLLTNLIINN
jgi:hypothetical protein